MYYGDFYVLIVLMDGDYDSRSDERHCSGSNLALLLVIRGLMSGKAIPHSDGLDFNLKADNQ